MDAVSKEYCAANHMVVNERSARDQERIRSLEELTREMSKLAIEMQQMIKRHDEEIKEQNSRISALEKRPGKLLDKMINAVISLLIGGFGGLIINMIVGG